MDQELFADVIVDLNVRNVDRLFTYRVPPHLREGVAPGSIIRIPFRNKILAGFVVELREEPGAQEGDIQIRDIMIVLQKESPWSRELIELSLWMHRYYGCSRLEALKASLPPLLKIEPGRVSSSEKKERFASLREGADISAEAIEALARRSPRQAAALTFLAGEEGEVPLNCARNRCNCTSQIFEELEKKGFITLETRTIGRNPTLHRHLRSSTPLELNPAQKKCLDRFSSLFQQGKGGVMLLHGVTGSGKTEIYLQALDQCLSSGKSGIVLIPEISLTPQTLDRFRGRFGNMVALLHSHLAHGERHDEWKRIQKGEAQIVLGARSAIFAPLQNIGLIILDEEHESSYKQEGTAPRYHARHIAIRRALHHNGIVMLGSATPSLESYSLAGEGKYNYCFLPERVLGRKSPAIHLVDLTKRYHRIRGSLLSPFLIKKMKKTLRLGEQIILFLNRRGFFNYLYCEECGFIVKCGRCDISLRLHKEPQECMRCHYCHYEGPVPDVCPKCKGLSLSSRGGGTQRVETELRKLFPSARILRMDRDTIQTKGSFERIYDTFSCREADILLGTQMIAKGLDFPGVTLVGVILADVALSLPDFRAAERAYQLLVQVAGRTSRGDTPGEVVIQTYNPEHPSIAGALKQDSRDFYLWELANRKELDYPPLRHIIKILFSGESEREVKKCASTFKDTLLGSGLPQEDVLGPAPCPVAIVHNRHRHHLILKCGKVIETMEKLKAARQELTRAPVNIIIDVDSMSFL